MPLGNRPSFKQVQAFFGGSAHFSHYVRGGAYVPNIAANSAISTTVSGLRLSQFSYADKVSGVGLAVDRTSGEVYFESTSANSGSMGVFIQCTPSGGNGTYTYSAQVLSNSGGWTTAAITVTGNRIGLPASVSGVIAGGSSSSTIVWRLTCTSNGSSTSVDITAYYNYVRSRTGGGGVIA